MIIAFFALLYGDSCDNLINCHNVVQISMERKETKAEKLIRTGNFDELKKIHQLSTIGQQTLTDYYDAYYIGPISVGTPAVVTDYLHNC